MPRKPAATPPVALDDPDNPEWTGEDFARSRPAAELPDAIRDAFPRMRGKQKSATKIPVYIRLSPRVVEHFKRAGPGWQTRINDELLALVERTKNPVRRRK